MCVTKTTNAKVIRSRIWINASFYINKIIYIIILFINDVNSTPSVSGTFRKLSCSIFCLRERYASLLFDAYFRSKTNRNPRFWCMLWKNKLVRSVIRRKLLAKLRYSLERKRCDSTAAKQSPPFRYRRLPRGLRTPRDNTPGFAGFMLTVGVVWE